MGLLGLVFILLVVVSDIFNFDVIKECGMLCVGMLIFVFWVMCDK